jgi:hypothetical protein
MHRQPQGFAKLRRNDLDAELALDFEPDLAPPVILSERAREKDLFIFQKEQELLASEVAVTDKGPDVWVNTQGYELYMPFTRSFYSSIVTGSSRRQNHQAQLAPHRHQVKHSRSSHRPLRRRHEAYSVSLWARSPSPNPRIPSSLVRVDSAVCAAR